MLYRLEERKIGSRELGNGSAHTYTQAWHMIVSVLHTCRQRTDCSIYCTDLIGDHEGEKNFFTYHT